MSLVAALLLLADTGPAPSHGEAVHTLDLGTLTWLDAQRLHGKPIRVRFVVDGGRDGFYEAEGAPGVTRCVAFWCGHRMPELAPGRKCVAEGVLRVSYIPEVVIDGERREALRIVTIEEATLCR
jgi:hypothetical protein